MDLPKIRSEYIFGQPPEGFFHPGERQGQVHADGKFAVERAPVLPGHAHVPAGFQQFIQRFSIVTAPCAAVQEEHIRSLRPAYLNAGEMFLNVAAGEIDIFCKYLAQLIHPFFSFPAVRSDEAVHRADIHAVVVGSAADGANPVPKGGVVDNVIAADQAGQVKGLAGRIKGDGAVSGIRTDSLGGNVIVSIQGQV